MFEHLLVYFELGFDLGLKSLAMLAADLARLAIQGYIDKNER